MKVFCISGKASHGKDTVAGFMKEALELKGNKVLIVHYGDLVKYICKTFFGWNGEKDEHGRGLLQRVGTDVIREQYPNYWVNFVQNMLQFFPDEWDYVLIPDCRFPNEVNHLKKFNHDVTHIRVVRENYVSALTPEQQNHISETALDLIIADHYIINAGTLDELEYAVHNWINN